MKRGQIIGIFIFMFLISMSFVAAASLADEMDKLVKGVLTPAARAILGDIGDNDNNSFLFAKVLFALIIFAIVWTALRQIDFFGEHSWVLIIISLATSILSVRFLGTEEIIGTIILPYSTLGIAITAGLPFVLWFILVNVGCQGKAPIIRRVAWIFFTIVFAGLWLTRRATLISDKEPYAIYIYPVTALFSLVMAAMDGTIEGFFNRLEEERARVGRKSHAVRQVELEMAEVQKLFDGHPDTYRGSYQDGGLGKKTGPIAYNADMAFLEKQRRTLMKRK